MEWKELILMSVWWRCAFGSIVEFNETVFNSLPPLYALDEWSECQHPGDVYCMVDAGLVSQQPSPMLELLQEYSKQTLKHYNRSVIHRGVCVSRCGTLQDGSWDAAAQRCLNVTLHKYGLQSEIQSVGYCSERPTGETQHQGTSWAARALGVVCTLLVALACLATVLHALGTKCGKPDCNKYLMAFSLKRNWAILTHDRTKPRTDERMKDIACMEGIRVMGMQCVIFSHVMLIYIYSYIDNPQFVEKMYDQIGWKAVLNSPLWIQAFFSISGFLTAYTLLIVSSNGVTITFVNCLLGVVNRWIRLTPLAVFALWFTMSWFPLLGGGPQWAWVVRREAEDCAQRWWYHVLYVHNYLPTGKFCMGHTWYLAVDMQLHILGVLLMLVLLRRRTLVVPVLGALLTGSMLASGLVVYFNNLTPIVTAQAPETLRTMFAGSKILSLVYLPMWMNLPGYVAGMATAFVFHQLQVDGIKVNQKKWFNIIFHLSLSVCAVVIFSGAVFLSDREPPLWAAAVYAAVDRTLIALFFNIFMLGCICNCKSVFRSALDWRGFHVLGRLSYCVYLIHFIVLRLTVAGNTQLGHASILSLISLLITSSVLSYIASLPLVLLVELPAIQLFKAATDRDVSRSPTPLDQDNNNKTIDRLDNVRRQV